MSAGARAGGAGAAGGDAAGAARGDGRGRQGGGLRRVSRAARPRRGDAAAAVRARLPPPLRGQVADPPAKVSAVQTGHSAPLPGPAGHGLRVRAVEWMCNVLDIVNPFLSSSHQVALLKYTSVPCSHAPVLQYVPATMLQLHA